MIVASVMNLVKTLIFAAFGAIELPSFPSELNTVLNTIVNYLRVGVRFIFFFFDVDYIALLAVIVFGIMTFDEIYYLALFVLKKIPFLGIK